VVTSDAATFSSPLIDGDQHYYEPADAFTNQPTPLRTSRRLYEPADAFRRLDRSYRHAIRWADVDGRKKLLVKSHPLRL
jgi:hypothetical protein